MSCWAVLIMALFATLGTPGTEAAGSLPGQDVMDGETTCNEETCPTTKADALLQSGIQRATLELKAGSQGNMFHEEPESESEEEEEESEEESAYHCCFGAQGSACSTCFPFSMVRPSAWCGMSGANCGTCSGSWCEGSQPVEPTMEPGPTQSPTTKPTQPPPTTSAPGPEWETGTWTTGYWDCCKPSCSWPNKGNTNRPFQSCDATTGERLQDANAASVCGGGDSASCADNAPFVVEPRMSMGFAAIAVSGAHGLKGDENCGQCFELKFVDTIHPNGNWGGSHPDLVDKSMVVQVSNIGYDVNGEHSFDLQIPGAGQGIFVDGCTKQFPGHTSGDFDCDNNYGGCFKKEGCARLPQALQAGCEWRYDWYRWFIEGGQTNNPWVNFRRVKCPQHLINISGSVPDDDSTYPEIDLSKYQ